MAKCCDITAGQLKRRIILHRLQTVPDGSGGVKTAWTQVAQPWAKIKPKSGSEKLHADRLDATGLATVIIRYREDITESDKMVYKGEDYQIRSIIDIEEMHQWLELTVERGVAQ